MNEILQTIQQAYTGYASYFWREITFQTEPWWKNYFMWLMLVSLFFFVLELLRPWRPDQAKFRRDFWMDFFYMFFNFFLFSLVIYFAASTVVVDGLNWGIKLLTGFDMGASNPLHNWPKWAILLSAFVVRDFIQWNVHRLLHGVPWLWEFHKVHHSVKEMGFAAHLRYHWMENVVYKTIEYVPLALLFGIDLYDFFILHIFTLAVGHYNHSNIQIPDWAKGIAFGLLLGLFAGMVALGWTGWPLGGLLLVAILLGILTGPYLKYIFNSPEMHLWHHAYHLPENHKKGINYGITLSLWDYLFKTDHIPHNKGDIKLGFPKDEKFPQTFWGQLVHGFVRKK